MNETNRIKWTVLSGKEYEGTIEDVDNGTLIVRLDDGSLQSVRAD